jgi:hypothetical protein
MTARPLRIVLPAAAVLGAVALPAPALATPALTDPLKPCYVSVDPAARQVINIHASGFTPASPVDVTVDDAGPVETYEVNRFGNVFAKIQAPYQQSGERPITVTLAERDSANTLTLSTRVTALAVTLKPKRAATSSRIRFRGRGFTRQKAIWAHYVFQGRVRKTVRFATLPSGACGTFSVRRRQIPIAHPRAGVWTLQVDQQKRWSPKPKSVFVPIPITVRRVIGGR